jgi:hypothetical protein
VSVVRRCTALYVHLPVHAGHGGILAGDKPSHQATTLAAGQLFVSSFTLNVEAATFAEAPAGYHGGKTPSSRRPRRWRLRCRSTWTTASSSQRPAAMHGIKEPASAVRHLHLKAQSFSACHGGLSCNEHTSRRVILNLSGRKQQLRSAPRSASFISPW